MTTQTMHHLSRLWVAAAALAGLASATVSAQTATDVQCTGCVNTGDIATGAVTSGKLATGSVTTGRIGNESVTTGKIAAGAVTNGKLGTGSVTSSKIASGAVTGGKLAASARASITVFSLSGTQDSDIPVAGSPTLLRDVGQFDKVSHASTLIVHYQDLLRADADGTICALQVRIDGNASPSSDNISPPRITNFTTDNVNGYSTGVFFDIPAGMHTVSIYYRNLVGTCDRNSGNWDGQITVIEMP